MHLDPYILAFSALTVIATIWMGFWSARKSRTAHDFFVAGRSVSVGWNASAISGEYLSAASFMGVAGMVMSSGYDALWYPVCYACGYLFLLLFIAGPLRRFGAYTIPDFAEGRYDSPVFRKIAVVFVLFIGFFYTMPQMKGAGTTLAYIFPGLPYWAGVVLVGAVITLNVALGGMKGITLVQAFQYWAKMFAISVPIFVLMAVYGHYGNHLNFNQTQGSLTIRGKLEFKPLESPSGPKLHAPMTWPELVAWAKAKRQQLQAKLPRPDHVYPAGLMRFTDADLKQFLAVYEQLVGKAILMANVAYPGNKYTLVTTNAVSHAESVALMQNAMARNGLGFLPEGDYLLIVYPTNRTDIPVHVAAFGTTTVERKPPPANAPGDEVWLNPFGPLTTKAAKAANAAPRWNFSLELRASLIDVSGKPHPGTVERMFDFVEGIFDPPSPRPPAQTGPRLFEWTNMPPNTSRSLAGPFPMLLALEEYGLLAERPVFVATNLPRPGLPLSGSFRSRDEFLMHLETLFLTNGVRLDLSGDAVKAISVTDWNRYQQNPAQFTLVSNRPMDANLNLEARVLLDHYRDAVAKETWMATNLPAFALDPAPRFEVLLPHEMAARIASTLAQRGITLISNPHEVWAVPSSEVARYQLGPVAERPLALLYTYSLIIALVCGTAGLPHILVRFYTNPDGVAAKRTTMWVMILIGVFYLFPPVFGVMGRNLLPELYAATGAKGTDKIVLELPRILNERYAPLGSILSGITCAGAFAAFMSTFSGLLVSMTGALAHDVYGRMLRPRSTPQERMRMFKIAAVLLGAMAIVAGMQVEPFQINFMVGQAFAIAAASYFPMLFMSAWWRGMTMKGAAAGMMGGGLLAVTAISLTSFSDLKWIDLSAFWAARPLLRILCEQPAIWAVPLALGLMVVVSKLTRREVPADIRMKMLVLHAPEKLGLKQEYIQEHQASH